jgi:ABC-2 type transport system ATP-binding protein
VRRVLDIGLRALAGRRIRAVSGWVRRRVALAQALFGDPQLLLLDKPTAGLDPEQRQRFRRLASELSADRVVLISTHQTEDVAALCQPVVVLDEGRSRFAGAPCDLAAVGPRAAVACRSAPRRSHAAVAHRRGPPAKSATLRPPPSWSSRRAGLRSCREPSKRPSG